MNKTIKIDQELIRHLVKEELVNEFFNNRLRNKTYQRLRSDFEPVEEPEEPKETESGQLELPFDSGLKKQLELPFDSEPKKINLKPLPFDDLEARLVRMYKSGKLGPKVRPDIDKMELLRRTTILKLIVDDLKTQFSFNEINENVKTLRIKVLNEDKKRADTKWLKSSWKTLSKKLPPTKGEINIRNTFRKARALIKESKGIGKVERRDLNLKSVEKVVRKFVEESLELRGMSETIKIV